MYSPTVPEVIGEEERERLILQHLPQVRLIARRIQERLPENISLEDLISTGVIGLIAAIDNFDPRHNVKLKTYAEYKIRGAILDSLRGLDWAPRQKRRQAKRIEAAIATAEQRLKRAPDEQEIADELEISLEEYHEWLVEIRGLNIASLEYTTGEQGKDLLHYLPDGDDNLPSKVRRRSPGCGYLGGVRRGGPGDEPVCGVADAGHGSCRGEPSKDRRRALRSHTAQLAGGARQPLRAGARPAAAEPSGRNFVSAQMRLEYEQAQPCAAHAPEGRRSGADLGRARGSAAGSGPPPQSATHRAS